MSTASAGGPTGGPPAVRFDQFSFALAGRPVLEDIHFDVRRGEFVGLVGPSGCGKTTLLNVLAGLADGQARGTAQVGGAAPRIGAEGLSYMPSRDSLLPWRTALDNAAFGLELRGVARPERTARAASLLRRVGLGDALALYPKALSQGMRQRVALARTFAVDAPLLLMDEPFGALDAQTKLHLHDLLLRLCDDERRTVLFVTHDLSEAVSLSDRVVVLGRRPARVVADLAIDLPRPRRTAELLGDPHVHDLQRQVWGHLADAWSVADA